MNIHALMLVIFYVHCSARHVPCRSLVGVVSTLFDANCHALNDSAQSDVRQHRLPPCVPFFYRLYANRERYLPWGVPGRVRIADIMHLCWAVLKFRPDGLVV
ncbi:hypothetical protein BDY17DRAFT_292755 [Neohortaea acidophila]|uniref:Secreted protein n=1 Tax=Neohortaea acidophila TaxID=245834 RepID=A0A6A6PYE4_9PEZI|nr:uncharacterized protein BDY17DRAFT_292755 [Neohortaea acidophila]KAF2485012.1 hypothetical protein BDY17DRAFT_292755 [Neohortaea acidophila]